MPIYRDPSPEDMRILGEFCSLPEIAAISRVTSFDLIDVLRAGDATLTLYTHPSLPAFSPLHRQTIAQRLKFELGLMRIHHIEQPEDSLAYTLRIEICPGPITDRKFLGVYTRIALAIVQPYLSG